MLVVNINRKQYMGIPMALLYLALSGLERSSQCQTDFQPSYLVNEPS